MGFFPDPNKLPPAYFAEDNSGALLGTCIAFLIIETFFIFLMYTSRFIGTDQKVNVWMTMLMTGGYVVCIGKISIGILLVQIGGAGRHLLALQPSQISNTLKLQTALQVICPLTTSLTKLGICCLLLQILGRTSRKYTVVIKATFILILCILLIQVIIPFANCKPFSKTWNPQPGYPGKCAFQGLSLWRYLSIPNVVSTLIMILIPIPALHKLKVSVATKMGLGTVITVCVLGMVAGIIRFQAFLQVQDFNDITYELINPLCWTIAESGIYLVAGVLPTLRPLLKKVFGSVEFDKVLSRTFGKSSGSWGNKRGSRMGVKGGKPLPPVPGKAGLETTELEYAGESGRSSKADTRDTVFSGNTLLSTQEQSIIVMMERSNP